MTTSSLQFPPIFDRERFPVLTAGEELPTAHLVGCKELAFFAPEHSSEVSATVLAPALKWHQYGDARWPSLSSWIEIDTSAGRYWDRAGVLVVNYSISENEKDPFRWAANAGPLHDLFPQERAESVMLQRLDGLRQQAAKASDPDDPPDTDPRFVQSYCIYRKRDEVEFVASYTDLLNGGGIPIPRYRMAAVQQHDIEGCRFVLHALFRLNEARRAGMRFFIAHQIKAFEPVFLSPGESDAPWARFHPSRVLRTRPAVRAIPNPRNLMDGIMPFEAFEAVTQSRRREANLHLLAFDRDVRPRTSPGDDSNATMAAFSHRANGGAIYMLPDSLVEEFDNTDCDEVQIADIRLPFSNVFVKFTPPVPLSLTDGALVDGCYVVKQGDEYLLSLTSRWERVNYSRSLSVACVDPAFSIHLPTSKGNDIALRVNEAVELGVKEFLEKNAPPTDNQSGLITHPDGTTTMVEDVRARSRARRIEVFRGQEPIFRACLNIIVNAMCFISFRPEDITEEWDGDPPEWVVEALNDARDTRRARDRRQHAQRVLATGDFTRIKICGKNLFEEHPQDVRGENGRGVPPRAHWRRGHWRRQRHGVGLSLVTPRWIRPTLVKKDNGTLVETRLYDVQADTASKDHPKNGNA